MARKLRVYLKPPAQRVAWLRVDRLFGEMRISGDSETGRSQFEKLLTVNSWAADYRCGEYVQELLIVSNGSVLVWQSVSVTTGMGGGTSGSVWTPKTPENYGYDLDGNTTSDGRWTYSWDAENRLTRLVANTTVGPQQRIDFEYDWRGRRIRKKVWNNTGGTGTPAVDLKFVYEGWNLVAELDANASSNLKRSYVWGLDLSGSEQGAGGVGGLLLVKPASGNPLFVAYDGNGNVTGLIDATTGTISAQYEYGPFGETIRMSGTGTVAKENPFRFSTKYQDDESDLLYYGYRYYSATLGRWLSRDTVGEAGGPNLAGLSRNDLVNQLDVLGRKTYDADKGFADNGLTDWWEMKAGDTVINVPQAGTTISVQSTNLERNKDKDFAAAKCALKALCFKLPKTENGVYWGTWPNQQTLGVTVLWTGPFLSDINFCYLNQATYKGVADSGRIVEFEAFIVTVYHEVKGHNVDEQPDGPAFEDKYEKPIYDAIKQKRATGEWFSILKRCEVKTSVKDSARIESMLCRLPHVFLVGAIVAGFLQHILPKGLVSWQDEFLAASWLLACFGAIVSGLMNYKRSRGSFVMGVVGGVVLLIAGIVIPMRFPAKVL